MNRFQEHLKQLEEKGRTRRLTLPGGIDLTSNDYLGLKAHPALREAAIGALEGGIDLGTGGSRLLRGHTAHHENLEHYAAAFFGFERTLYFSTGTQANAAIFSSLPDRHDVIIYDERVHASARDGIAASHAKSIKVRHNDLQGFEDALKKAAGKQTWIAVESVYSMDGDSAPLCALSELSKRYGAYLVVDEAHATGVEGKNGRGLCADLDRENLIVMHACGKALGIAGGLVCAPCVMIDTMINTARPFIFSTAPPPLQALLVHRALAIAGSAEGDVLRSKLSALCAKAKTLWGGAGSHIVPVILGDDKKAVAVAEAMQGAGYDIRAIRPPTVPEGTARLRLSLSASLDEKTLEDVANLLSPYLERRAA